jgi:hypothetical protein
MSRQTRASPQEDHQIAARLAARVDKLSLFRDRLDGLHDVGMELWSVRLGEHVKTLVGGTHPPSQQEVHRTPASLRTWPV